VRADAALRSLSKLFVVTATAAASATLAAQPPAIVGTWLVKDSAAPFPWHMYVFNADGTMQQANPDAGDPHGSDSDGKGAWEAANGRFHGRWMEITADRATHRHTGFVEVRFDIAVTGDTLTGSEEAQIFDRDHKPVGQPIASTLAGTRVTAR
jgi:hypothetical protein